MANILFPLALTRAEAVRRYGVSRKEIDALIQIGRLKTVIAGRRTLILSRSIDEYLCDEAEVVARLERAEGAVVFFETIA